jgi:hypothetical protein
MGLAPMIPGIDDLNSFFTDHASFVSLGIRGEVAPSPTLLPSSSLSFTFADVVFNRDGACETKKGGPLLRRKTGRAVHRHF